MPAKTTASKKDKKIKDKVNENKLMQDDGDDETNNSGACTTTTTASGTTITTAPGNTSHVAPIIASSTDNNNNTHQMIIPHGYRRNERTIQRLPSLSAIFGNNITHIGSSFLRCCSSLKKVDLSPLRNVTHIGHSFMMGCVGLKAINLAPLSKVTHLGSDFLRKCKGLSRIDARPMKQLTSIPDGFLSRCSNLELIDIPYPKGTTTTPSSLSVLHMATPFTSVGARFLSHCSSLRRVDLSPLLGVEEVGGNFLHGCTSLGAWKAAKITDRQSLDLTPISHISRIPAYFLANTGIIDAAEVLEQFVDIREISPGFLFQCVKLENINLTILHNITEIPENFLAKCWNLQYLDLAPLKNVTSISSGFLYQNQKLNNIVGLQALLKNNNKRGQNNGGGCKVDAKNFMTYCPPQITHGALAVASAKRFSVTLAKSTITGVKWSGRTVRGLPWMVVCAIGRRMLGTPSEEDDYDSDDYDY